jgi:hypothetical protein
MYGSDDGFGLNSWDWDDAFENIRASIVMMEPVCILFKFWRKPKMTSK